MTYLLIAFAAFFVVTLAQGFIRAHDLIWGGLALAVSFTGLWLCGDLEQWYGAFAISGMSLIILRVENLLMIKADESLVSIKHRR